MKLSALLLLLVLVLIGAFAALNWGAFVMPIELSLALATVQAPLGLIMLGLLAFVTALFLAFVVYLQTSVLLEARRHARELQANRGLADQAEASRFTELRAFLNAELAKQNELNIESRTAVLARVDGLERDLRTAMEQSDNSLAAHIGEPEDRLERGGVVPRA